MKYLLAIALALLAYIAGSAQNKLRKEINYIKSTHKGTNEIIVETGKNPNLYFLQKKNNPLYAKHALLIKQQVNSDFLNNRKLFEIGFEENTKRIKTLRVLNKTEEEKYKHLQPVPAIAVAAAEANDSAARFYDSALTLFNERKFDEGINIVNKAIIINTQNPDYHQYKALCLGNLKQYQQSTDEATY